MSTSSLPLRTDRTVRHLKWVETTDGWGGDAEIDLVDSGTPSARIEWLEGPGTKWQIWIFVEGDYQTNDILLLEDLDLALVIERVMEFTKLRGTFHHYEIIADEHSESVTSLLAELAV